VTGYAFSTHLPRYLHEQKQRIEKIAGDYGLDFYPVAFEVLAYDQMNEVASYGGFPTRYPHWRFGMEYERMSKSAEYGLSKIYEMVINNNPSIAYLLEGNSLVDQKLVMAHVYGHVDFFKNNFTFQTTNQGFETRTGEPIRKWIDTMANHGALVRRWANRVGIDKIEAFIDQCLSLENLIDPNKPYLPAKKQRKTLLQESSEVEETVELGLLRVDREYMENFINPEEFVESQRKRAVEERERQKRLPERPDRDVLGFLIEHAPLERWERDILGIIRREAYYFYPQMQTKIMNEGWACVAPDTLVFTDVGLVPMREVVEDRVGQVSDGAELKRVYDRHVIRDHETITIRTRRGFELTGSNNHRIQLEDGTWRRLDELCVGDRARVAGGNETWPAEQVSIDWHPKTSKTLDDGAEAADVSVWTVLRHRAGRSIRSSAAVARELESYEEERHEPRRLANRRPVRIPSVVTEDLGAFLGYLVGDGHISRVKRHLGLTTGDVEQAERFASLAHSLFDLPASIREDEGRLRVLVHAESLSDFLTESLGLTSGPSAREKRVPRCVLRSPEPVVRQFLRAYFDCDGHAGKQGVVLVSASRELVREVALLLANYGILSRVRSRKDETFALYVTGTSAARFLEKVGFNLARKERALTEYVNERRWFEAETWDDAITSIEPGRSDVYDLSVEDTHRYAAAGFVNHNSYWHSRIMTEKACDASEIIEYAERNAGVMATSPGQFNPYKLGVELYRHVEERWNKGQFGKEWEECDDLEARRNWNRRTGMGREKLFQVRKLYNDVTFIDEFLTPDFVMEQKLYAFGFNARNDRWEIETRKFEEVKRRLLFQLTNAGQPFVYVVDANHGNRGELLLNHEHQGIDLRIDWAREVLRALEVVWRRPVEIHTLVEKKPTLMRYDGKEHVQRPLK
jgi:stage V sporulation protein R